MHCPKCGYWSSILCPCNQNKKIANEQVIFNRLLELYPNNYAFVGKVCDEILDKSGRLLGEIRIEIFKSKEDKP
jgi:hypothetical protein